MLLSNHTAAARMPCPRMRERRHAPNAIPSATADRSSALMYALRKRESRVRRRQKALCGLERCVAALSQLPGRAWQRRPYRPALAFQARAYRMRTGAVGLRLGQYLIEHLAYHVSTRRTRLAARLRSF